MKKMFLVDMRRLVLQSIELPVMAESEAKARELANEANDSALEAGIWDEAGQAVWTIGVALAPLQPNPIPGPEKSVSV